MELILRFARKSVTDHHFFSGKFWVFNEDFGDNFEFMFVLEGHDEIKKSLELRF
jgi:hypothetical protein